MRARALLALTLLLGLCIDSAAGDIYQQPVQFVNTSGQLIQLTLKASVGQPFQILAADACPVSSFLLVEAWDLNRAYPNTSAQPSVNGAGTPLLAVALGSQLPVVQSQTGKCSIWSYSDLRDFQINSPYVQVQLQQQSACSGADDTPCWSILLQNMDLAPTPPLDSLIRFSCVTTQSCASPVLMDADPTDLVPATQCSGQGTCNVWDPQCSDQRRQLGLCVNCDCDPPDSTGWGWGGVGCDTRVKTLNNSQVSNRTKLPSGAWAYYQVQIDVQAKYLLVQMIRTAGDTVLFVKPDQPVGFQPWGLPQVPDFQTYADTVSFKNRQDYHYILLNNTIGRYYIGVYNNDMYMKEDAKFSLNVTWTTPANNQPLCPLDCSGHGLCQPVVGQDLPQCVCFGGWGGAKCEGPVSPLVFKQTVTGYLQTGQWQYFTVNVAATDDTWKNGILVQFWNTGGQAVLVAKAGSGKYGSDYPTYVTNDFLFTSQPYTSGPQTFKVRAADLNPGSYNFGVFNMDYIQHESFKFTLTLSPNGSSHFNLNPYLSIILGVTVSLFLCLAITVCRRVYQRHGLPWRPRPAGQVVPAAAAVPHGVDPALVQAFPTFEYKPSAPAAGPNVDRDPEAGMAQPALTGRVSDDSCPQCSVCLCEYEAGERLRRLPHCGHEFHLKCIDLWLTQHTTCPMCRASLLPDAPAADPEAALQETNSTAALMPQVAGSGDSAEELEAQPVTPHSQPNTMQQRVLTPRPTGQVNSEERSDARSDPEVANSVAGSGLELEMAARHSRP